MDGFRFLLIIACSYAQFSCAQITLPNVPQTKPFLIPQTKPFFLTTTELTPPSFPIESIEANSTRKTNGTTTSRFTTATTTPKSTNVTTANHTHPATTTKESSPKTTSAPFIAATITDHTATNATTIHHSITTVNRTNLTTTTTTKGTTPKPSITQKSTSRPSTSASTTESATFNSTGSNSSTEDLIVFHPDGQSGSQQCNLTNGCGVSSQDKIIGGTLASPHEFPWLAHLIISKGSRSALCTGFLVTNRHVITAAHCTKGSTDEGARLTLGTNSPSIGTPSTDNNSLNLRSIKIVIHPQYDERTNVNDISVITVDKSVSFTDTVRPICLPAGDGSFAGRTGTIAGWGTVSEGGAVTKHLMKATVPILTNRDPICTKAYGTLKPQMICAGGQHMDTCQGDSGGPLMISNNGVFTAIGIVSFGIGCGRPSTPGVYARITALKAFIDPQIRSGQTCNRKSNLAPTTIRN